MSVFHRTSIAGACCIASDKDLSQVLFTPKGEVIAQNQYALYVSTPTENKIEKSLPFDVLKRLDNSVCIETKVLEQWLKTVPADKTFKSMLEHVKFFSNNNRSVTVQHHDGRTIQQMLLRETKVHPVLESWKNRVIDFLNSPADKINGEFVFNRKRMASILSSIESACKYDGEYAFIRQRPMKNGYVWSSHNELTSQRVYVFFTMPVTSEKWYDLEWENSLKSENKLKSKIVISVKKK